MIDKIMKDKIKIALQDKRNGSRQAIYARIRKYGTPFKTVDGRYKYGTEPIMTDKVDGLSRQQIHYRIKRGWDIKKAKSFVRTKNERDS